MSSAKNFSLSPDQAKAVRNHVENYVKTLSVKEKLLLETVSPYTMLPPSRLIDAFHTARQLAFQHPTAAIAEFGVFGGGCLVALALGASSVSSFSGRIFGFDTFEGHLKRPGLDEVDLHGRSQAAVFDELVGSGRAWASYSMDNVRRNLHEAERIFNCRLDVELVKGDASVTAKSLGLIVEELSCLRLDMDWREPTKCALESSLPLLSKNAVIIVDDYGHHSGVKDVLDEFISSTSRAFDYSMTDYSCLRIRFLD
jgi:hypothetical protein